MGKLLQKMLQVIKIKGKTLKYKYMQLVYKHTQHISAYASICSRT